MEDVSLSTIRGIGPARLKAFEAAGISSVRDLVMFLPRDYRDLSAFTPLSEVRPGDTVSVRVRVAGEVRQRRARTVAPRQRRQRRNTARTSLEMASLPPMSTSYAMQTSQRAPSCAIITR